jgi:hypothetical protein
MSGTATTTDDAPRTLYRPRRARLLRGKVSVTHAIGLAHPSWHLDPSCGGLDSVVEERRALREFPNAWSLAEDTDGRICRMCTLESLLHTLLRSPGRTGPAEPVAYVTFSSRPSARHTPTASGQARLRRIAKTLGLATTSTPSSGIVAHGFVAKRTIPVLETNLEIHPLPWVRRGATDDHLQCFWSLIGDHPGTVATKHRRDTWTAARLLTQ